VDKRCVESFGDGTAARFAMFRKMYSSATSKRLDGRAPPSNGKVYVAPDKKIESRRELETFPGSNVGK
jgi:hypothetical protein